MPTSDRHDRHWQNHGTRPWLEGGEPLGSGDSTFSARQSNLLGIFRPSRLFPVTLFLYLSRLLDQNLQKWPSRRRCAFLFSPQSCCLANTLPPARQRPFGQILLPRQREGLPLACCLQACPTQQEVRIPAKVKMFDRFVCCSWWLAAGRRRDHAHQVSDRWC